MDAKHCRGCRNDFYNIERSGCWALKSATLVTRWRQGWWDAPPPGGPPLQKVEVPDCYRQPGKAAYMESP